MRIAATFPPPPSLKQRIGKGGYIHLTPRARFFSPISLTRGGESTLVQANHFILDQIYGFLTIVHFAAGAKAAWSYQKTQMARVTLTPSLTLFNISDAGHKKPVHKYIRKYVLPIYVISDDRPSTEKAAHRLIQLSTLNF
jgi:hypothetical protein